MLPADQSSYEMVRMLASINRSPATVVATTTIGKDIAYLADSMDSKKPKNPIKRLG